MARQRIKAVDPITTGWLSRGVLVNFYQSNLRALDRGVAITRIFVMTREEMHDPDIQKILMAQYAMISTSASLSGTTFPPQPAT